MVFPRFRSPPPEISHPRGLSCPRIRLASTQRSLGATEMDGIEELPLPLNPHNEVWRPAVGVDGYEVSCFGRMRNAATHAPATVVFKAPGYLDYVIQERREIRRGLVHRVVLLSFVGPPLPDQTHVRHLNGDSADNRLENLAWGTPQQNADDRKRHGTSNGRIDAIAPCRVAAEKAKRWREIRRRFRARFIAAMYLDGMDIGKIARLAGVTYRAAALIARGETLSRVTGIPRGYERDYYFQWED